MFAQDRPYPDPSSIDFMTGTFPGLDANVDVGVDALSDGVASNSSFINNDAQHAAVPSDTSYGSADSLASASSSRGRRRRRGRKQTVRPGASRQSLQKEHRRYQCTFCTDTFKTKHDWQRHERALHLSLDQWQ